MILRFLDQQIPAAELFARIGLYLANRCGIFFNRSIFTHVTMILVHPRFDASTLCLKALYLHNVLHCLKGILHSLSRRDFILRVKVYLASAAIVSHCHSCVSC